MIAVTDSIEISEDEIKEQFIRSGGPGGQNVNKVATAVKLRFDALNSPNLTEYVRGRAISLAGSRATKEGEIIIESDRYRTREQNRADALERLIELLVEAAHRPKPRRKTRPSLASKERKLKAKKVRGEVKAGRRAVNKSDY